MSRLGRAAQKARVLILISGTGSNMAALVDYSQRVADCPYTVVAVAADRPCQGLDTAKQKGIPTKELDRRDRDFTESLLTLAEGADYIVLAGFLSILEPRFIRAHTGRILNIHPSLLPKYGGPGLYGQSVHAAVLATGETVSGCTVHLVDEGVDSGRILLQQTVPVLPGDSPQTLAARILPLEHQCIVQGLLGLIAETFKN